MKTSLKFLFLILSIQLIFSEIVSSQTISEIAPLKDLKFGISTGFFNKQFEKSYQLGIITEYKKSSPFAFELDLSSELRKVNLESLGRGRKEEFNLDLSLNSKYYFGEKNTWYGKLGYYFNKNLFDISKEDYSVLEENSFNSGIQIGVGRSWNIKKGSTIKFEPILRYNFNPKVLSRDNKADHFHGGIKLGFTF